MLNLSSAENLLQLNTLHMLAFCISCFVFLVLLVNKYFYVQ